MLTKKLLAALGLAGALLLVATAPAEARGWGGHGGRPVFRGPVYRAPIYRAPIYRAPVYQTPVYQTPVYAPVYAPVYRPVGWRHYQWVHGRRW